MSSLKSCIPFLNESDMERWQISVEDMYQRKHHPAELHSNQDSGGNDIRACLNKAIKYINNQCHVFLDPIIYGGSHVYRALCSILDTASSKGTIHFHLGSGCDDNLSWGSELNTLINSIIHTKATTVGYATGPCSTLETAVYVFCREKHMLQYGQLLFAAQQFVKENYKEFFYIYQVFLTAAQQQGILTKEECEDILNGKVMTIDNTGTKRYFNK